MKTTIVSLFLTLSIFLTGCGGDESETAPQAPVLSSQTPEAPATDDVADEVFVEVVTEEIPELGEVPESAVIDLGEQICDDLSSVPLDMNSLLAYAGGLVEGADGFLDYESAGFLIGAATYSYCPEINEEITQFSSDLQGA